jgi:hypothetical protein
LNGAGQNLGFDWLVRRDHVLLVPRHRSPDDQKDRRQQHEEKPNNQPDAQHEWNELITRAQAARQS